MNPGEWQWPVVASLLPHQDRVALMRLVPFESTSLFGAPEHAVEPVTPGERGQGLSLNISSGGMLLLIENPPEPERVLRVHVPTPAAAAQTPTLAEVRWVRPVPFEGCETISFVGLKFLL